MQDHWDENIDEVYEDAPEDWTTYIRVNGSTLPLEVGADFETTVKTVAQNSKMGKFRLFLNGSELFPEDGELPDRIEEGMQFDMKPYDKAGL
jgi:hypothetical protein